MGSRGAEGRGASKGAKARAEAGDGEVLGITGSRINISRPLPITTEKTEPRRRLLKGRSADADRRVELVADVM